MKTHIMLIALLFLSTSHAQISGSKKEIYIPPNCTIVPNSYLVRVPKAIKGGILGANLNVEDYATSLITQYGGTLHSVYDNINRTYGGFGVTNLSSTNADSMLKNESNVLFVEQVCEFTVAGQQSSPGWALDRIDQTTSTLNNQFDIPTYNSNTTHIYIIDQAIRGFFPGTTLLHTDLATVKATDPNAHFHFRSDIDPNIRNSLACTIHGTAVAGLAAGARSGVARNSTVHSYAAFDCQSPARSNTIFIQNALNNILENHETSYPGENAIINISANLADSSELAQTISDLAATNIMLVLAMGNSNTDGCELIRSLPQTFSVAASGSSSINTQGVPTSIDARWPLSNYGSCVDIYAPGSSVTTTTASSTSALTTETGTSFAAPLVTGTAAVYLEQNPNATIDDIITTIKASATLNTISGVPNDGGENDLLNICFLDGACSPPPSCTSDMYEQNDNMAAATNYSLPIDNTGNNTTGLTIVSDSGWRNNNYCDDSEDWTAVRNLASAIAQDDYYHFVRTYLKIGIC